MANLPSALPPEIVSALREGRQLEAIKLLRKTTGLGLVETKALIDAFLRSQAPVQAKAKAHNKIKISVTAPPPRDRNLSPGEVPHSTGGPWAIMLMVAAAVVAYLWLR